MFLMVDIEISKINGTNDREFEALIRSLQNVFAMKDEKEVNFDVHRKHLIVKGEVHDSIQYLLSTFRSNF